MLVTTIFQNVFFLIRSNISSIILDTMKLVFVEALNFVKFTFFLALQRVLVLPFSPISTLISAKPDWELWYTSENFFEI